MSVAEMVKEYTVSAQFSWRVLVLFVRRLHGSQ